MFEVKDWTGRLQLARPHVRRFVPQRLHHFFGHLGRWLVRVAERWTSNKAIENPVALPEASGGPRTGGETSIVLVTGSLTAGGAERQVVNLFRGLAAKHRRALLLTLCLDDRSDLRFFLNELEASCLEVHNAMPVAVAANYLIRTLGASNFEAFRGSLGWAPADVRQDIIRLAAELHRVNPTVVHGWQDAPGISAAFAALAVGTPRIVVGGRNVHPEHFSHARPYMLQAYRFLAKRPEVVLANNSAAGARSYANWLGVEKSSICVVHNGVVTDKLMRPASEDVAEFRRRLGIRDDELVVGGAFRLQEEKRPLLWVEVAARLMGKLGEVRFVIFGEGTMHHRIRKTASRLGVQERLLMPGNIAEIRLALAMFDVLLLTSSHEGTPNVVLEATCLGVPVVATDVGGVAETMIDGKTGFVVYENAVGKGSLPDAIADAVIRVLSGGISIRDLRSLGPGFVNDHFGLDQMIENTLALYDKS